KRNEPLKAYRPVTVNAWEKEQRNYPVRLNSAYKSKRNESMPRRSTPRHHPTNSDGVNIGGLGPTNLNKSPAKA
ncbi:MAG: hypothetical protein V2I33_17915, partial [Kangiellaceae bacterium]|nr:hypothetical protein [Kangiellaceae bacterium]